jgi:hypothetical protein
MIVKIHSAFDGKLIAEHRSNTNDADEAVSRAIKSHYGASKYLIENRGLTNGGSRIFGQVAHSLRGYPRVSSTDSGTIYVDVD